MNRATPGAGPAPFSVTPPLRIIENAPLQRLNTFGVSVRARRLVVLDDDLAVSRVLAGGRWLAR